MLTIPMDNQPLVSIIIPTYQRWHLLCEAIESVFLQSYQNWEIVVVNDDPGSSPQGLAAELLRNPRVLYVVHDTNKGLAAARNTGIEKSSGTYLAYLDDDDIFYPDHLESLISPLSRNGWHVAYADAYEGSYEVEGSIRKLINKKLVYYGPFAPQRMWQMNCIPVLSVIHHRECLEKTGGFDIELPVLEDWDLWLRMLCHYKFHFIPKITSEYRAWGSKETMSQGTSDDKWNLTQLQIYQKCTSSPGIMADNHIREMLQNAIFRFVRRKLVWLTENFKIPDRRSMLNEVLLHVTHKHWVRVFFKKPFLTLQIAYWRRNKR